jgi:hypothetical protein
VRSSIISGMTGCNRVACNPSENIRENLYQLV